MPPSITVAAFVIGVTLLVAALIGKEINIVAVHIPALSRAHRMLVGGLGAGLIYLGLFDPFARAGGEAAQVTPTPPAAVPTLPPTSSPPAPQPTELPQAPAGFAHMEADTPARWAPGDGATWTLARGTFYRFTGERSGGDCRIALPADGGVSAQPWVACAAIGVPDPIAPPVNEPAAPPVVNQPAAPPVVNEPVSSPPTETPRTEYQISVTAIAPDEMRALPGCAAPSPQTNVCIVGPGNLNMELINLNTNNVYPFTSDSRLIAVDAFPTRIMVVSDHSSVPVHTAGANEFMPEAGQMYKLVVTRAR